MLLETAVSAAGSELCRFPPALCFLPHICLNNSHMSRLSTVLRFSATSLSCGSMETPPDQVKTCKAKDLAARVKAMFMARHSPQPSPALMDRNWFRCFGPKIRRCTSPSSARMSGCSKVRAKNRQKIKQRNKYTKQRQTPTPTPTPTHTHTHTHRSCFIIGGQGKLTNYPSPCELFWTIGNQ